MSDRVLQDALNYLRKGYCPIPAHGRDCQQVDSKGKKAAKKSKLFSWKSYIETLPSEAQVTAWFSPDAHKNAPVSNCSCNTSVALVCGHKGLAVVDLDNQDLFMQMLEGASEETLIVKTKRGFHMWFSEGKLSKNVAAFGNIQGLDIRSKGGYVLAPPSEEYSFYNTVPIKQLAGSVEDWCCRFFNIDLAVAERSKQKYKDVFEGKPVTEGARDDTMVSIAGKLKYAGLKPEQALETAKHLNQTQFSPPLEEEDVVKCVRQVFGYDDPKEEKKPEKVQERDFDYSDLVNEDLEDIAKLETTFLGKESPFYVGTSHLFSAYPKVGKTTFLFYCIKQWLEAKHKVLFLSEEGKTIWIERYSRIPIEQKGVRVHMAMGETYQDLEEHIKEAEETVIVLDNTRLLGISDENNASEVYKKLSPLIASCRETDKTLILIHHASKAETDDMTKVATGSHAYAGTVDTVITIKKPDNAPIDTQRQVDSVGRIGTTSVVCNLNEHGYEEIGTLSDILFKKSIQMVKEVLGAEYKYASDIRKDVVDVYGAQEQVPTKGDLEKALVWLAKKEDSGVTMDTSRKETKYAMPESGNAQLSMMLEEPAEEPVGADEVIDMFSGEVGANLPYKD